jgi:hypothetical protein
MRSNTGPGALWSRLWRLHRGKLQGGAIGLVIALLIMWARWWSILIVACVLLGAALGAALVDSHSDVDLVDE